MTRLGIDVQGEAISGSRLTPARQRADALYVDIRDRICTNQFPPGSVLREEELMKEFEVGRTLVRRVLVMLEQDQYLMVKHGVGTIVAPVEAERLVEIYDVRMALALASGAFFPSPFPTRLLEHLYQIRHEFGTLRQGDLERFGQINICYYGGVIGMVGNRCLQDLSMHLFFQTSRMWLLALPEMNWGEMMAAILDELDELIRVVRLEDREGLGFTMRNHIFMSRNRILLALNMERGGGRGLIDIAAHPAEHR